MKKRLLYFFLFSTLAFATTVSAQTPSITSFFPISAKPGDVVTLTGTNFNASAVNNVVFFGATSATVTAASTTSLTLTVPVGATYAPITVLDVSTNLAAYSATNFNPIYSPAKINISPTDFQPKQDFRVGDIPYTVAIGDLDGDGKPDLAVINVVSKTISLLRNISNVGSLESGSFAPKVDLVTGDNPFALKINDLDGDGKLDIIIANRNSNTLSVYRNTSTIGSITLSSFTPKVDFPTGISPTSIAIGDLDGDGKVDIAVASLNSSTISVLRNTSVLGSLTTSSFAAKIDLLTALHPQNVDMADLDGDGKLDLISANGGASNLSVFLNTSSAGSLTTGSFATKVDFSTGNNPISLIIGDLDTDGKPDLTVANFDSNSISILANTSTIGTVSFANKIDFTTGLFPQSVTIGDLDGDGKPDLAVANASSNSISFFRNIGSGSLSTGSFAAKVDFVAGERPTYVAIGDLDGDCRPDLAVANSGSRFVSVMRNVLPPSILSFSPKNAKPGDEVVISGVDFNKILENNIVFFGATQAIIKEGFNSDVGSLAPSTTTSLVAIVPIGATYAPITLLNKGTNLTAASATKFNPIYSPAKTSVKVTDFLPKIDFIAGNNPNDIAINDLDGDGRPDLVVTNQASNTVSIFLNTSSNDSFNLVTKIDFATGSLPRAIVIGDINGDGKSDLVITNQGDNTISVLINTSSNGIINFAPKVDFVTGITPVYVAIGDLDLDGKLDLVISNSGNNSVSILKNISYGGVPNFDASISYSTGDDPYGIVLGDIDGDGLLDIALTNHNDESVSVYGNTSNNGILSFANKIDFSVGKSPQIIAIGDLDGDDKLDLAIVNSASGSASVLRNISTSGVINFEAKIDFNTKAEPRSIAIGDIDGDGKPDLVVGNTSVSNDNVSVLQNTSTIGALSFSTKVDLRAVNTPLAIIIGDLNGDTKPDIALSHPDGLSNNNSISVLLNVYEPVIQSVGSLTALSTTYGSASASTSFSVSGKYMQAGILITAPYGFELSTNDSEFSPTLELGTSGNLAATTVYVRLKSISAVGNYSGDIILSSLNATTLYVATINSTVTAKELTVTVNSFNKTYNGQTSTINNGVTFNGFVNGENEQNLQGRLTYYGSAIGAKEIGTYVISATGLTSINYAINYQDGSLTITKALLKIIANAQTKVYGESDPAFTYTSTGLFGLDAVTGSLTREAGEQVDTYLIAQGTLSAGGNYDIVYTAASLSITKALLNITANNKVMCQSNPLPIFTVSYTGFKNNDNLNSLIEKPQITTTANSNSPAGTYPLTPAAAVSKNYNFSYANGTLIVNALPVVTISSNKGNSISKGEIVNLTAAGGTSYFWANSSGIISGQSTSVLTVRPSLSTTYTVTATNANGCSQTTTFNIVVREDFQAVKANNILTPNGDGVNDIWLVENIDVYPNNFLQIFDRGGRVLFTKRGYNNTWDGTINGKQLAEGTYYYLIDFGPNNLKQKGFITLIR